MVDERALLELIASSREALMAAVKRDGYAHLTNVSLRLGRQRARRAGLDHRRSRQGQHRAPRRAHVVARLGRALWSYAVAECDAEPTDVTATPGDAVCRELLELHTTLMGEQDEEPFFEQMVEARRMVIRLRVRRVYGVLLPAPPR